MALSFAVIVYARIVWEECFMLEWTPIAVNEKPLLRGKRILPEYSAAVVGNSVVLRLYTGGFTRLSMTLTNIPFATSADAAAWVEAHKADITYASQASSKDV
jgi:hypothetical protein